MQKKSVLAVAVIVMFVLAFAGIFVAAIKSGDNDAFAMQLYINVAGETIETLEVEPSDSIENIKAKIEDRHGYPISSQTLYYDNTELSDDTTLWEVGITSSYYSLDLVLSKQVNLNEQVNLNAEVGELVKFYDYNGSLISVEEYVTDQGGEATALANIPTAQAPTGWVQDGWICSACGQLVSSGALSGYSGDTQPHVGDLPDFGNYYDWSNSKHGVVSCSFTAHYTNDFDNITFAPSVVTTETDSTNAGIVFRTIDPTQANTVVVNYDIINNDGINNIVLIPEYDTTAFTLTTANVVAKNNTVLGTATITGTEVAADTIKIAWEHTAGGNEYAANDEAFLTLTFTVNNEAIANGMYDFGLDLDHSVANTIIASGNDTGEQVNVPIIVSRSSCLNNIMITRIQTATITIGYNRDHVNYCLPVSDGFTDDDDYYRFEYSRSTVGVEYADDLAYSSENLTLEPSSTNGMVVYYTVTDENGNVIPYADLGTVTYTWYQYQGNNNEEDRWVALTDDQDQPTAPAIPGIYKVDVSVAASAKYYAIPIVSREVEIAYRNIVVYINNQTSKYGEALNTLTHSDYSLSVLPGDSVVVQLNTTATPTSPAGDYDITGSVVSMEGYYTVTFKDTTGESDHGTYTITQTQVTLTPVGGTHPYTGEYYSFEYTVSNADLSADALATIKATLDENNAVTVTAGGATQQRNADQYLMYISVASNPTSCQLVVASGDIYFTITPMAITITATPNQTSVYGDEIVVDQSKYTLSAEPIDAYTVSISKATGSNAGNYALTPSINFTTSSNAGNYNITTVPGTYTIQSAGADADYIKSFFSGANVTYDSVSHDLLVVANGLPGYCSYNVTTNNNVQTNAGSYVISITVTADSNHHFDNNSSSVVTSVTGVINKAQLTISAVPADHVYGGSPAICTYNVSGTNYNNEVTISCSTSPAVTASSNVGTYDIVVSASSNSNYDITTNGAIYTVSKGTATVNLTATDVYYNRVVENTSSSGSVGTISVTPQIKYYSDYECNNEVVPTDVGVYYAKAIVPGTTNYNGGESEPVQFYVRRVQLDGLTFTYDHGTVTWTNITKDTGKTTEDEQEVGVTPKDLTTGTTLTYYIYDSNNELVSTITSGQTLSFNATDATDYYVISTASDGNYGASRSYMATAYEVTFTEGSPDGDVSNMPATQYIFEGQKAVKPENPSVTLGFFSYWELNGAHYTFEGSVTEDIELVAIWGINMRTITLKYLTTSATPGTDMFTLEAAEGETISYAELAVEPVKSSSNAGIYYTFANKWMDTSENIYDAVNDTISGYTVTTDMTFVAIFNTNYNSFTVTYYFSNNESKYVDDYAQFGDPQSVTYGATIEYRTYTGDTISWFKKDYWYANTDRTEAPPATMPAENISVYGTYKFDIGQGDVNADRTVTANDITLYRQWIVGGYSMIVVASGDEWATVTDEDFDETANYYLMRVADINVDESEDIRDVSITRMALVGGYTWDIVTGESVTGGEIIRNQKTDSYEELVAWFESGRERVSVIGDITAETADFVISTSKDIFIDLCGNTLTVKSINFSTSGTGAKIALKNGTIVTTNGITITAPNGNVEINNVTAYDNGNAINLQAASSSLHFFGAVAFRKGTVAESSAADVKVAAGTHIVIEEEAQVVAQAIVAAVIENNTFVADTTAEITITNESTETEPIEIIGSYVEENSTVESKIITKVSTKEQLLAIESGKTVYLGADIEYAGQIEIVNKTLVLDLNGYTIRSTDSFALNIIGENGNLTIKGEGNVIAQEACARAKAGATLTIEGGTFTTVDNYVVGTHGSVGNGNNTIIINGGTFNGNITTTGYIACGVYVANCDTIVINGGTFNVTDGCGVLARSGNTTIKSDVVFNMLGESTATGKVGDSRVVVPAGEALVLDLEAKYPGGIPTINNETDEEVFVIVNGTYTFANDDASFHAARGVYDNVILTADLNDYLYITKDMNVYLNGHTVDASATSAVAIYVVNGAKVTINGDGVVKGTEGCVIAFGGSEFTINGGTYICYDNFIFGTNGTEGEGGNTITINKGDFYGEIKSAGYIACGVYVANDDTVVINGGTFTITDGIGILARSGNTTIGQEVVINIEGDDTLSGKVGDKNLNITAGSEIVKDLAPQTYPGGQPTVVNNSDYDTVVIE